jgi:AraC family transcriptional regulator, arabinose operon regulatory protein
MNSNVTLSLSEMLKVRDLGFNTSDTPYLHPNRTLNWHVFIYIAQGQMQINEDGNVYILEKGQFAFLKSHLHHWGEIKSPIGTAWYWIHFYDNVQECTLFNGNPLLPLSKKVEIEVEDYEQMLELPKYGIIKLPIFLKKNMERLIGIFKSDHPFKAYTLSTEILNLFLNIFTESAEKITPTKSDDTVHKILMYMNEKKYYPLHSSELELTLGMNYSYLCEVFKKKTGCTLHFYNAQIFVNRSTSLMRTTTMNISEISNQLGFNSPFYFNRVFKKIIGCSPSEYLGQIYRN